MTQTAVALGEVADFVNGVAFGVDDWSDEGRPIIRIQNLNDPEKPFNRTKRQVGDRNLARRGDLLVSWAASLGVYEWQGEEACINQHIFKVIPRPDLVDQAYLRRSLEASVAKMEAQVHGATMKHITRDKFLNIRIPLPPRSEQRRIAVILGKADALRAKRREAIAKLDQLLQSVFLDMFGDPIENTRGYNTRKLSDLVDPSRGISYGVVQRGEHVDDGVPLIRIGDLSERQISLSGLKRTAPEIASQYRRTSLRGGEIVLSIRGTVGRCAVVPENLAGGNITRELALIPHRNIQRDFLLELLRTDAVQRQLAGDIKGVAQRGINLEDLRELPVITPPELQIDAFATCVQKIEGLRAAQRAAHTKVDAFMRSFGMEAFGVP